MRKKLTMALLVFAVMLSVPLVIGAYSEDSYAAEAQVGSLDLTGTVEIPEGGFLIDEGSQLSIGDDFVLIGNGSSIKMEAGSMVSFMEMTKVLANDVEITVDGKVSLQSNINFLTQSFDAELVTNGSVEVKVFSNFAEENTEAIYVKLNSLNLTIKMAETGDADIDLEIGISEVVLNSNGSTASAKDVSVNADMLVDIPDIPTILTDYTGEGLINVTIGSFEISNETDKMSVSDITAAIDLNYKGMTDYSLDMKASVGSASYSSTNDSPDSGTDVSLQIKGMSANVNVVSSLDSVVADEYAGLMVVELGVDEFSLNNSSINSNYTYKNIIDVDGLKVYGELSYSMSGQNLVIMSDSSKTNATLDYGYYLQSSGILGTESGYEATLKNVSAGLTMNAEFVQIDGNVSLLSDDTSTVIPSTPTYMIQTGKFSVDADVGYLDMKTDDMTTIHLENVSGNITVNYDDGINQSESISAEGGMICFHIGEADWEFQDAKFVMDQNLTERTNRIDADRAIKTYVDDDGNTVKEYYVDVVAVNDGEPVGTQVDGFDEPTDYTMIYAIVIVVAIVVIAAAAILIKKRKGAGEA